MAASCISARCNHCQAYVNPLATFPRKLEWKCPLCRGNTRCSSRYRSAGGRSAVRVFSCSYIGYSFTFLPGLSFYVAPLPSFCGICRSLLSLSFPFKFLFSPSTWICCVSLHVPCPYTYVPISLHSSTLLQNLCVQLPELVNAAIEYSAEPSAENDQDVSCRITKVCFRWLIIFPSPICSRRTSSLQFMLL